MNWCWLRWHFLLKCPNNILGLDRPLPHYDSLICGLNKIGVKQYKDKKPLLNGLFIVNIKWSFLLKVYCTFWLRSTFLDTLTLPPTLALNMLLTPLFVAWTTESLSHYFWESFNDQHKHNYKALILAAELEGSGCHCCNLLYDLTGCQTHKLPVSDTTPLGF